MEWSREDRYRRIEEVSKEELNELKEKVDKCPYRQNFHIQPKTGLLNDPNGFSYFNGEYHLFYQWFPLGPVHGVKYWYHISSKDLVIWKDCGIALEPDKYFDSHGVFSGTGLVEDNKLHLFYTGNTRDENWIRHPYQCLAIMNKNGEIKKMDKPVIDAPPKGYTDNFRDPKVFKNNDKYYCLIGAETKDNQGAVVYYESDDLLSWNLKGEITTKFKGTNSGFMWECPDYFEFEDNGILMFSPQGIESDGDKYLNIFQSGYLVGDKINFENGVFNHTEFKELDRGFDFYAPQTMEDENGRRILIGWFGLPGVDCITDKNGWAHCLTIPRELKLKGDKLLQLPVEELKRFRKEERKISFTLNNEEKILDKFNEKTYEMICSFDNFTGKKIGVKLRVGKDEETTFYYDLEEKKLILDRSKSGELCTEEYGVIRKCKMDCKELKLQIFVDTSSVEIFVKNGEEVFTGRIFTKEDSTGISFFADGIATLEASIWNI